MSLQSVILAKSPSVYWKCDDAVGATALADSSGSAAAVNLTLTGTPGTDYSLGQSPGVSGNYIQWKGAAGKGSAAAPASAWWGTGYVWSAKVWFKIPSSVTGQQMILFNGVAPFIDISGGKIRMSTTAGITASPLSYNDNTLHMAAVVRATAGGSNAILYVDGVQVGTAADSTPSYGAYGTWYLGAHSSGLNLNGGTAHANITPIAETAAQILAEYNAGAGLVAGTATAAPGNTQAFLSITGTSGGNPSYNFQWYQSTTGGVQGSAITGGTTASYTATGLTNGTTYYFTCVVTDSTSGTPLTATSNQASTTPQSSFTVAIGNANIAPCGTFADGYAIDRAAKYAKSLYAGWDFTFTGSSLSMGLANLFGGVGLKVTVDGATSTPGMPASNTSAWPASTVIWTGSQGTHTAQVRETLSGNPNYLAIDSANAFTAIGTTPGFAPPADTGPTYVINQAPFERHSAREGAWQLGTASLVTGTDAPTLYSAADSDQAGQVLRWRGHATKIRLRGKRDGAAVLSFLQDGVAGNPFAVSTDVNDPYGWFTLGIPTDTSGDHEYGLVVNSGTFWVQELQMCGGALNTTATFPQRGNLVGFGDSKMVGAGLAAEEAVSGILYDVANGYLFKAARAANRACLNMAKSGSTLLTDPIGSATTYQADVIASYLACLPVGWDSTQDVIVWELGYNDAARVIDGTTPATSAWTAAITPKLAALAATGATVLIYAIPASSTHSSVNSGVTTDTYAAALNTATQAAVTALGASNVTFKTGTRSGGNAINGASNPNYATPGAGDTQDGVHFNHHGESLMVAILAADVPTWSAPTAPYTAASNVRSGTDRGDGTIGTLVVPAAANVLTGTTYDATTAGTATLPTAAQVLVGVTYGAGGNGLTGTVSLPIAGDVESGVTFGPALGSTGTFAVPAAANVRSATGYGSAGTEFTGTLVLPSASTVLIGTTYDATTAGTVTLPVVGDVEAGVTFGASLGSTGTFAVPIAANVRTGIGYGAGGSEFTGTLVVSGGTYTAAANVRSGTDRGDGTLGTLVVPAASTVLLGTTYDATTTGTVTLPPAGDVEAGVTYGPSLGTTGTFAVPIAGNVRTGIGYGAAGTEFTGTLVASGGTYTAASNVRSGTDRGDGTIGTLVVPTASHVLIGTTYDATTAGTVTLPSIGDVEAGVTFGASLGSTGTFMVPTAGEVESGIGYGAAGTEFTGTLNPGSGATANQIADAILLRDWTQVVGSVPERCLLQAERLNRNAWDTSSGTQLVVMAEDDVTPAWSKPITTAPNAPPITKTGAG